MDVLRHVISKIRNCDSSLAQEFEDALIKSDLDGIKSLTPLIFEKCGDAIEWHEIVKAINYIFPSLRFKDLAQIIGPFIVKDLMKKILKDLSHWLYLCTTDTCIYREIEKAITTICSDFPDMGLGAFLEKALKDILSHSAKFLLHTILENVQRELSLNPVQLCINNLTKLCFRHKCCLETFNTEEKLRETILNSVSNEIINTIISIVNSYMKRYENPLELEKFIDKELMNRLKTLSKEADNILLKALNNLKNTMASYLKLNIRNLPISYNAQPHELRELLPILTKPFTDEEIKEILKRWRMKKRKWLFKFFK